jgi:hypothetical protein
MDCEGSEINILRNINIRPRVLIVETHPSFGSPTDDVVRCLTELDYKIVESHEDPGAGDILVAHAA